MLSLVSFRVITNQDSTFRKMPNRDAWRSQASLTAISGPSLLGHLSQFMESAQSPDDRIKACYLTARLVQDDADLQRKAIDTNTIARCVEVVKAGDREQPSLDSKEQSAANIHAPLLGPVVARRMVEAGLTAIATLCTFHEPAKQKAISLGILPLINHSLQSPAYATRTAACQVARVLSRSIAILRTTLVDSGVAKNVVGLLRAEEQVYATNGGYEKDAKRRTSTTSTVLSAATATICNLICEFSPMQTVSGGIALALWAPVDTQRYSFINLLRRLWHKMVYKRSFALQTPRIEKFALILYGHCEIWSSRVTKLCGKRSSMLLDGRLSGGMYWRCT